MPSSTTEPSVTPNRRSFLKKGVVAGVAGGGGMKSPICQKKSEKLPKENLATQKRSLRVVKWIGTVSAIGVCTGCATNSKVPLEMLKRTSDAQENLRKQFEAHQCERRDASVGRYPYHLVWHGRPRLCYTAFHAEPSAVRQINRHGGRIAVNRPFNCGAGCLSGTGSFASRMRFSSSISAWNLWRSFSVAITEQSL